MGKILALTLLRGNVQTLIFSEMQIKNHIMINKINFLKKASPGKINQQLELVYAALRKTTLLNCFGYYLI